MREFVSLLLVVLLALLVRKLMVPPMAVVPSPRPGDAGPHPLPAPAGGAEF